MWLIKRARLPIWPVTHMSTHPFMYPSLVHSPAVRLSVFSGEGAEGDVSYETIE